MPAIFFVQISTLSILQVDETSDEDLTDDQIFASKQAIRDVMSEKTLIFSLKC